MLAIAFTHLYAPARNPSRISHTRRFLTQQKPMLAAALEEVLRAQGAASVELDIARLRKTTTAFEALFQAPPKAKSVIFILDRTWQPILNVCVDSIAKVFSEYMDENLDTFGLYGLGDGWLINMAPKSSVTLEQIQATKTPSGACILYSSMLTYFMFSFRSCSPFDCEHAHEHYKRKHTPLLATLARAHIHVGRCLETFEQQAAGNASTSTQSNWLVVLTDTVDLESSDAASSATAKKVLAKLQTANLNLAIIDSAAISGYEPNNRNWAAWKSHVTSFKEACGDQGHHIKANDSSAVAAGSHELPSHTFALEAMYARE